MEAQLANGYNAVRLARWAYDDVFFKYARHLNRELEGIILDVVAMQEDPQFELSEEKLRELAKELQEE